MKLKPTGKLVVLLLVFGVAIGMWKLWGRFGGALAPAAQTTTSLTPDKANLPMLTESGAPVAPVDVKMPGSGAGCSEKTAVRFLGYAWNAQMGLHFANGGPQSTEGSLMCKNGVNLTFARQDDNSKLQEALVAFATELKQGNAQPEKGAHFVTIMGDGAAAFIKPLNDALSKVGPEYKAKVIGACGYSRGEDKFMGPGEWKSNPSASRGGVVAGVIRDGDWNIAQKWLGDNGLRTNPDEKTYDPDALNWVNASDYIDAGAKYIAGYSEDRPVVRNGKPTGETKHIVVNGVVTWTPGDVNVAEKKGGLVSIVSTKEYSSQMPCIIIGIDKWCKDNRSTVQGMLAAIAEGGRSVKGNVDALRRASEVSAAVYKEQDAEYWMRYYRGLTKQDATGQSVDLGGSSADSLPDMLLTFGLVKGSANIFAATYKVFGDIVAAQYPNLLSGYQPVEQIVDTSYMEALAKTGTPTKEQVASANPKFDPSKKVETVLSKKAWNIHFDTGKATIAGDSQKLLQSLSRDLIVASNTKVEIHGHTDNQGSPTANQSLSEARAFAVKRWLESRYPVNFSSGRVRVLAHGSSEPVAENSTQQGRAANRRVEIVLGN